MICLPGGGEGSSSTYAPFCFLVRRGVARSVCWTVVDSSGWGENEPAAQTVVPPTVPFMTRRLHADASRLGSVTLVSKSNRMADNLRKAFALDMLATIVASWCLYGKLRTVRDLFHTSGEILTIGGCSIVGLGEECW